MNSAYAQGVSFPSPASHSARWDLDPVTTPGTPKAFNWSHQFSPTPVGVECHGRCIHPVCASRHWAVELNAFGVTDPGYTQASEWGASGESSLRRQDANLTKRKGLSLLEVILALAILGLALAAISQLVWLGARAAGESRDLTRAQIIAESILAQLSAEVLPVETVEQLQVPQEPDWVYSTLVEGTEEPGLVAVHVVVEEAVPQQGTYPLRFIVTRWMVDPEVVAEGEEALLEPTGADL